MKIFISPYFVCLKPKKEESLFVLYLLPMWHFNKCRLKIRRLFDERFGIKRINSGCRASQSELRCLPVSRRRVHLGTEHVPNMVAFSLLWSCFVSFKNCKTDDLWSDDVRWRSDIVECCLLQTRVNVFVFLFLNRLLPWWLNGKMPRQHCWIKHLKNAERAWILFERFHQMQ